MVNYNDGKWHGWNGGECPVHPESIVQVVTRICGNSPIESRAATKGWWENHENPIVAFRVVKEYVPKPREWWIVPGSNVALCCAGRLTPRPHPDAVLVREVLDGNACASAS